jgi:outer membrane protein TolC
VLLIGGRAGAEANSEDGVPELSLEEALAELERQNLDVIQARGRAESAAGQHAQLLGAALPSLTGSGAFTRNESSAVVSLGPILRNVNASAPDVPDIVLQPLRIFSASLELRVPILVPARWAEAAAASKKVEVADGETETVRLKERNDFLRAAWIAHAGEEAVTAGERAVQIAENQLHLSERAFASGTGTSLAVSQARTEATRRRSDLARSRADRDRARLAVGARLGKARMVKIRLAVPQVPVTFDLTSLEQEALHRRPEVRADAARLASAERQLSSARLGHLPEVFGVASAFAQDEPLPTGKKSGWRLTVNLSWALYDGGYRCGKAQEAKGGLTEARARADAMGVEVLRQVRDAVREIEVAVELVRLAEEEAKYAAEAADSARRGFQAGISSSLDVLETNDRLYRSELSLADARARVGIAVAALEHAVGQS